MNFTCNFILLFLDKLDQEGGDETVPAYKDHKIWQMEKVEDIEGSATYWWLIDRRTQK